MFNRWIMCSKCNIKLIDEEGSDDSVRISKCPVCKQYYLTVKNNTELMSRIKELAEETNSTVEETLRCVIKTGIDYVKSESFILNENEIDFAEFGEQYAAEREGYNDR